MTREFLKDFGEVKEKKTFAAVTGKNGKTAQISNRRILLQDYKPEYGTGVKSFTEEEIKSRHLGKIKCALKFKTDDELKDILTKYFA